MTNCICNVNDTCDIAEIIADVQKRWTQGNGAPGGFLWLSIPGDQALAMGCRREGSGGLWLLALFLCLWTGRRTLKAYWSGAFRWRAGILWLQWPALSLLLQGGLLLVLREWWPQGFLLHGKRSGSMRFSLDGRSWSGRKIA